MAPSILIIKLSSMGDCIHTLPALVAIRKAWPQATIGWAIEQSHAELIRDHPLLDEVIPWHRGTVRGALDFLRRLRRRRWDVAIDFQGLLRSAVVARLSGARRRIGYRPLREGAHWFYNDPVPLETMDRHAVERNLLLAAHLEGVTAPPPLVRPYLAEQPPADTRPQRDRFPLPLTQADRAEAAAWLSQMGYVASAHRLVVFCPDCRKPANRWPAHRFAQLADSLAANDPAVRIALCGGPGARARCDQIAEKSSVPMWRADGRFGLRASAALLEQAAVVVTGDTGPMHLAVAVGARVVALFGPANPLRTGPYCDRAIVLHRKLSCSPCFARHGCPLGDEPPRCMYEIDAQQVTAAVLDQLHRHQHPQQATRRKTA